MELLYADADYTVPPSLLSPTSVNSPSGAEGFLNQD